MARATLASASAQSDSIKGLAQSIAKPAYRRLLTAEPLLRRAVPVLIIAFLVTICVGAGVQVIDQRRQVLANDIAMLAAAADLAAERIEAAPRNTAAQDMLTHALPAWAPGKGRSFILTNSDGISTATSPDARGSLGRVGRVAASGKSMISAPRGARCCRTICRSSISPMTICSTSRSLRDSASRPRKMACACSR